MTRQVWFVTGASKGFGLCTVKALLKEGLQVAATTRSVPALLEAVGGENPSLLPLEVDLTSDAAIKAAVDKTVEKFGQIDVVLNNAGYGVTGAVEEVSNDEIRRLFDINFFAAHTVIQCVLPYMRARKSGYIINVASIAAVRARPGFGLYSASKAALVGMTTSLIDEVAPFGIKATAVCPGPFSTNIQKAGTLVCEKRIEDYEKVHWHIDDMKASKFIGDPEKAAQVFIKLAKTENPPNIMFLGKCAIDRAVSQYQHWMGEIEEWKEVCLDTDLE